MKTPSTILEDLFGLSQPKPDLSRFLDLMVDGRRDPSKFLDSTLPADPPSADTVTSPSGN